MNFASVSYFPMKYKDVSDLELWQSVRHDDEKAFNALFHRYFQPLYKQAARYINDTDVVKELILDLMSELWEKRNQKIISGEIAPYLRRWMRNKIVSHRRKAIPDTTPIDAIDEHHFLKEQGQADQNLIEADMENLYQAVLNDMPPQRRKVFQLSREENMSYAEIAREMNLSVNTVEKYMSIALQNFRTGIREYVPAAEFSSYLLFCITIPLFFL